MTEGTLPEVTRTGEAQIRENGFTSYFSVDGNSHSFSVRYYGDCWRNFPKHLKKEVARMVSSVWVAAIPSQEKVFTHRVDDHDIKLLKFISYQNQAHYRKSMKYPSMESSPTLHVTKGGKDWSDIELDDGYGVYFSGGRDAFTTLGLVEEAGYDPHIQMHNNGSAWDAGEKAREAFKAENREIDYVWNNFPVIKREITKEHGIFWHLEAPVFHMTFLESLPLIRKKTMLFGNEATTTRYAQIAKDEIFRQSWEQSIMTTDLMTKWAQGKGIDLRVGSILREMSDYRVTKTLYERYPEYADLAISCFFVNADDDFSPCSKCAKCHRKYLALEALGYDHNFDEERLQKFKMGPADLMADTLLPNDLSHMNSKVNFYPDVPAERCPEVEGLMFREDRCSPARLFERDEFLEMYDVIRGDDDCWIVSEDNEWEVVEDLDTVYDRVSGWNVQDRLDYSIDVEKNGSLLSY